uniref:G_PROTEIN_RECEP_F1_2 domain-containing protein n=1 Tax=Panagrellus redivivus TaxID=6233 RepID=A0A7E4W866_PANRE
MDYYPDPDQLLWLFVFRMVFATFCIVLNLFLLIVFIFSRSYRQSFHNWLTTMMAFADVIVGIGIFTRVFVYITGYPRTSEGYSRSVCLTIAIPQILGILWSQSVMANMANDRLKAVKNLMAYGNISFLKEATKIFIEWIIVAVAVILFAYLSLPEGRSVQCSTGSIASHPFLYAYVITGLLKGTAVLIIYYRALKLLKEKTQDARSKVVGINVHKAVFKRVKRLLFWYITFCVAPLWIVFVFLLMNLNENILAYGALFVGMTAETFSVASFFVLSWKNKEIKGIFNRILLRKSSIEPTTLPSHISYIKSSREDKPRMIIVTSFVAIFDFNNTYND